MKGLVFIFSRIIRPVKERLDRREYSVDNIFHAFEYLVK